MAVDISSSYFMEDTQSGLTLVPLTNQDIVELTEWRRKLHQHPQISNEEARPAPADRAALDRAGIGLTVAKD